jgi:hypothetical protein
MISRLVSVTPQVDGRVAVHEEHVYANGDIMTVLYVAEASDDVEQLLQAHAPQDGNA